MNRVTWTIPAALGIGMLLITACSQMLPATGSLPSSHPEQLPQGRPVCSECHEAPLKDSQKPYSLFDHTASFARDHRFAAQTEERTCGICHRQSFCTDCHANHNEIKPSQKMGDRPDRELVHRGDYMTRHKFEGKIDPVGCYRCHGRTNNEKCVTCHR